MAIANVQSNKNYFNGTSGTCAFSSNVTAGNLLIVALLRYSGGGLDATTCTDTRGNTYSHLYVNSGSLGLEIWYAWNTGAGANTVSIGFPSTTYCSVIVNEFSGALTDSTPLDQSDYNTGTGTTPSGGPITTTQAAEMLFAALVTTDSGSTTITPDADYTETQVYSNGATAIVGDTMYRIVASTLTDTANWTITNSKAWIGYVLSFKAASTIPSPNKSESVSVSESIGVNIEALPGSINTSSGVSVAENVAAALAALGVNVADTAFVTEPPFVGGSIWNVAVSDNVALSESITITLLALSRSVSETIGTSENVAAFTVANSTASVSDAASVSEAVAASLASPLAINKNESVGTSESASGRPTLQPGVSDTAGASDTVGVSAPRAKAASEAVSAAESIGVALPPLTLAVNDIIGTSESSSGFGYLAVNRSDAISTSDTTAAAIPTSLVVTISDTANLTDAVASDDQIGAVATQSAEVSESLGVALDYLTLSLSDAIGVGESSLASVVAAGTLALAVSDVVSISTPISINEQVPAVSAIDATNISESTNLLITAASILQASVSENILVAEGIGMGAVMIGIGVVDGLGASDANGEMLPWFSIGANDNAHVAEFSHCMIPGVSTGQQEVYFRGMWRGENRKGH